MGTKTSPEIRQRPNILITGVPCVGKTTIAQKLANVTDMIYFDVNEAIMKYKLHSGFDDEYMSFMLDEDRFLDHLEVSVFGIKFNLCFKEYFDGSDYTGGLLIDYHSCEFFPIRWFDYVIVLRCDNTQLYDRLAARAGYSEQKRSENLECEIMGVVAEEAHDAFPGEGVVHELQVGIKLF
jgi:broad-specificity NMP kinase